MEMEEVCQGSLSGCLARIYETLSVTRPAVDLSRIPVPKGNLSVIVVLRSQYNLFKMRFAIHNTGISSSALLFGSVKSFLGRPLFSHCVEINWNAGTRL